ncbi:MAG: S-methyl-5'-thioadenosine phosphorylase, partial [Clostridia bacterium]|nr:S-methyl-5'-thioadenosine phosphorylase [Clostridia bacterium]
VYACTEGPRFETAAEIRMIRMLGAQTTGMVLVPEAPLCRDLGMEYAAIGIIANYDTGMTAEVTDTGIDEIMKNRREELFDLLFELASDF